MANTRGACPRTAPSSHPTAQSPRGGDPGVLGETLSLLRQIACPTNRLRAVPCNFTTDLAVTRRGFGLFPIIRSHPMTVTLHNPSQMLPTAHASNGARLVSRTGENLPLRGITLTCEAMGGIARTKLHQHFTNAYPTPLELTYSFPLPADGAVAGYEVHAGNRVITGRIERRDDARTQYETARLEGRTAGLVEQERPNLFTLYLGNIPPSTDVTVALTIDHALRWIPGGVWEWRFPTVVAPRYLGENGVVGCGPGDDGHRGRCYQSDGIGHADD